MHRLLRRRTLLGALTVGAVSQTASAQAPAQPDPWPSLAAQIFNGRAIQDGSGIVAIDAPRIARKTRRWCPSKYTISWRPRDRRHVVARRLCISMGTSAASSARYWGRRSPRSRCRLGRRGR